MRPVGLTLVAVGCDRMPPRRWSLPLPRLRAEGTVRPFTAQLPVVGHYLYVISWFSGNAGLSVAPAGDRTRARRELAGDWCRSTAVSRWLSTTRFRDVWILASAEAGSEILQRAGSRGGQITCQPGRPAHARSLAANRCTPAPKPASWTPTVTGSRSSSPTSPTPTSPRWNAGTAAMPGLRTASAPPKTPGCATCRTATSRATRSGSNSSSSRVTCSRGPNDSPWTATSPSRAQDPALPAVAHRRPHHPPRPPTPAAAATHLALDPTAARRVHSSQSTGHHLTRQRSLTTHSSPTVAPAALPACSKVNRRPKITR
jgi:hypothetical protein